MRNLIFTVLLNLLVMGCMAQTEVGSQEISVEQLAHTRWKLLDTGSHDYIIEFTRTEFKSTQTFPRINKTLEYSGPYHIAANNAKTFNSSLVGGNHKGSYIAECSSKSRKVNVFRVVSLSEDTLVLYRYLDYPDSMYIGGVEHVMIFKLISKNSGSSDDSTKAEESTNTNQEEETPVYTPESIITSLKQITPEISKIIEELTNDDKIIIDDAQRTRYDSQNKQIYIGAGQTDEKVLHAIMHYLQDTQGELSYENNSVNNEFEASWLTFLTYFIKYGVFNEKTELGLTSNENREMEEYLIKSLSGNCAVNAYFYDFMDQYMTNDHLDKFSEEKRQSLNNDSSRDEYWHSKDYDYEYNWMQKLEMLGFKYIN